MLAVVQMVYPTIKSDARLSLEILYFREIQTRTSPNVWAGASKERERERRLEWIESSTTRAHRRSFSLSRLACPLFYLFVQTSSCLFRSLSFSWAWILARLSLDPSQPHPLPLPPHITHLIFASDAPRRNVFVFGFRPDNLRQ